MIKKKKKKKNKKIKWEKKLQETDKIRERGSA